MAVPTELEQARRTGLPSLARVLPRVVGVIAVLEALIMFAFSRLPALPPGPEMIVDTLALSLLSAPILYLWIVRPIRLQLETHLRAEAEFAAALVESANRFGSVLETAPDGIIVIDSEGRIETANRAACEMFGWAEGSLAGHGVGVLMPAGHAARHDEYVARFVAGMGHGKVNRRDGRRLVARRKDGSEFPLGIHVNETKVGSRLLFTGVMRDLTAELARERELERQLARVTALQRVGASVANQSGPKDVVREAMSALREVLRPDSSIGALVDDKGELVPCDRERFSEEQVRVLQEVRPWERLDPSVCTFVDAEVLAGDDDTGMQAAHTTDGTRAVAAFLVRHEGNVRGILAFHWDRVHRPGEAELELGRTIADQLGVAIERERRQAEHRLLARAVDATLDSVIVLDRRGLVQRVNPAFERNTGFRAADVVGRLPQLMHADVAHRERIGYLYREAWKAARAGQPWSRQIANLRADGTHYPAELGVAPVQDEDGRIIAFVAVERDVTDVIAREEALRWNALQLEELNRDLVDARDAAEAAGRAKAEFLATMSHEIRTPMNGVLGFTQLLLDTELAAHQRDWVETIRNSGQSLLTIINDILDFSKIEAGKLEVEHQPYDLHRVVSDVRELMRPQVEGKGLTLDSVLAEGVPRVMGGDEGRVRQVLINLVGNAVKFTEHGGVTIELSVVDEGAGAGALHLAVRDTGIGIPEDKRSKLFQKFQQVDTSTTRRFGGTGLGLAISRRLVELMGGAIGADSVEGRGSTFWFTLPLPASTLALPSELVTSGAAPVLAVVPDAALPMRVLVAEDNSVNAKLVRHLLEKSGCRVDVAGNGLEALHMVEQFDYDLVFMDCHMPEMDGLAATRELRSRSRGSRLPIVALTASALKEDQDSCMAAGMDDFLTKPIIPEALVRCLQKYAA